MSAESDLSEMAPLGGILRNNSYKIIPSSRIAATVSLLSYPSSVELVFFLNGTFIPRPLLLLFLLLLLLLLLPPAPPPPYGRDDDDDDEEENEKERPERVFPAEA